MADEFLTREKPSDRTYMPVTAEMGTASAADLRTEGTQDFTTPSLEGGDEAPADDLGDDEEGFRTSFLKEDEARHDIPLGGNTPVQGTEEEENQNRTQDRTTETTIQQHGISQGGNSLHHVIGDVDNPDRTQGRTPETTFPKTLQQGEKTGTATTKKTFPNTFLQHERGKE